MAEEERNVPITVLQLRELKAAIDKVCQENRDRDGLITQDGFLAQVFKKTKIRPRSWTNFSRHDILVDAIAKNWLEAAVWHDAGFNPDCSRIFRFKNQVSVMKAAGKTSAYIKENKKPQETSPYLKKVGVIKGRRQHSPEDKLGLLSSKSIDDDDDDEVVARSVKKKREYMQLEASLSATIRYLKERIEVMEDELAVARRKRKKLRKLYE